MARPIAAGHFRCDAGFVYKNESLRIDFPVNSRQSSLRAGPAECLVRRHGPIFFKRSPIRFRTTHNRVTPMTIPCSRSGFSRSFLASGPVALHLQGRILRRFSGYAALPSRLCPRLTFYPPGAPKGRGNRLRPRLRGNARPVPPGCLRQPGTPPETLAASYPMRPRHCLCRTEESGSRDTLDHI